MEVSLSLDGKQSATSRMPRRLGIGFPYIPALSPKLYAAGLLDFVEIVPEKLCRAGRNNGKSSIILVPAKVEEGKTAFGELPIVVHGVELSIGSAHGWNDAYLHMLDRFQRVWPFLWHSEHFGFQTFSGYDQISLNTGVPLPLPATAEVLRLVSVRSTQIRERYGVPFLLENPAHYLRNLPCDPEVGDEIDLMNRITEPGTCGYLLDLHNLYCNAINHHFDSLGAVDRINLDQVLEIHIAGGSWLEGFWMDSHDGRVPAPVWELLEYTLPRCPNVAGVVFEILEPYALRLGIEAIGEELEQARRVWRHSIR